MGGDWFLDHHLDVKTTLSRSIGYMVSPEDGAKLAKFQNMNPLIEAPDNNSDGRSLWQNVKQPSPPTWLYYFHSSTSISDTISFREPVFAVCFHTVPDTEHGLYIHPEGKLAAEAEDLYKQAFEFLAKEMACGVYDMTHH
ncbi:hypothetical protein PILCRDRAFT_820385 [Piloderma croceum F 1598]|uniref:Uncharacterized protein n=1 Tax=Piloderma croceum (strain F 1598) TaxID=765440 RepID=A0A0C3FRZ2_PILCF|nr:hypothetical protein PILCRDRAFT_820385 [Piloderma croceum F 1598]